MALFQPSRRSLVFLGLIALSLLIAQPSKTNLRERINKRLSNFETPPLYLPTADKVKLITLGFDNFFADILWFRTVNYFGKQFSAGKDYRWLHQMCDLVTTLDPKVVYPYEFCGNLLAWEAKEIEASNAIYARAIKNHPRNWRFWYQQGFNYWYFLGELEQAGIRIQTAAKLPDAPAFLPELASKLLVGGGEIDAAISFLSDQLENAQDQKARKSFKRKLKKAYLAKGLQDLERQVALFQEREGRAPKKLSELVNKGYIRAIPKEPYGGEYFLDLKSGTVKTSSGKKPLRFSGKINENPQP